MERRLAAILAADVVGYSRLMEADEEATARTLSTYREVIEGLVASHHGRVFGGAGDSVIAEFGSPVEAVRCAVEIQQELNRRNAALPENKQMRFRLGVNLGDVMVEGDNLLGDGVNIAARLEALAPPGGVCISKQVADQIAGKIGVEFANAGDYALKNITKPVEAWVWPPEHAKKMRRAPKAWRRAVALASLAAVVAVAAYIAVDGDQAPGLPAGPRIALIPFKNVGEDLEDAYFSEGLTRDVNAQLSKFSNLFVIAPEAGAAFRNDPDCEAIREELGADYILTGSVRRYSDQIRVTTAFTDAKTCLQLTPPGPFDRDLSVASVLDIQIEIAGKVAAAVGSGDAPLFNAAVHRTLRDKAPDSLGAYECVLLSYWFYQTFGAEAHRRARTCLERTVKDEPDYSLGWSRLAFIYIESKKRSIDTPPDWTRLAREAANNALNADRDNPDAYYALAILSRMLGEDLAVYKKLAQRAIDLNPNDAWILADLGTFLAYAGEWEKGKEWVTRARALNPRLHRGYDNVWHLHAFARGDYEEARNIRLNMGPVRNYMGMASLTASYAMNGEQQEAEEMLARIREQFPDSLKDPRAPFRARGMPTELIEDLMSGLRKAGLPE
jgi:class 3 adenylate cyclase/TolB-like protein